MIATAIKINEGSEGNLQNTISYSKYKLIKLYLKRLHLQEQKKNKSVSSCYISFFGFNVLEEIDC